MLPKIIPSQIETRYSRLLTHHQAEFARRKQSVKAALETHYTYNGVMVQIRDFIQRAAGHRADADLRCRAGGLPGLVKGYVTGVDRSLAEKMLLRWGKKPGRPSNASALAGACS